jgi:ribonuclease P protein component
MLPRRYRLKRRDFNLIYANNITAEAIKPVIDEKKDQRRIPTTAGKRFYSTQYSGKCLKIRIIKLPNQKSNSNFAFSESELKIGIVISKKVAKQSVVRNRLRRQVRAILISILPFGSRFEQKSRAQSGNVLSGLDKQYPELTGLELPILEIPGAAIVATALNPSLIAPVLAKGSLIANVIITILPFSIQPGFLELKADLLELIQRSKLIDFATPFPVNH